MLSKVYHGRFEKLLLSKDEAIIDAGGKTNNQKRREQSLQVDPKRYLLEVEEITNKDREVVANAKHVFLLEVEEKFNQSIQEEIAQELGDIDKIVEKSLQFNTLGRLLDVLYTDACTITRLVECLESLPWLAASILKFIKQPKFQREDNRGKAIVLKTSRNALSFVGIDSLRTLIPILIARHTNPLKTPLTPDISKNMWLYTLGTGNIAKALAAKNLIRPHFGFCAALLANVGRTVVTNVYLKVFDKLLSNQIAQAQKANEHKQAKALSLLSPSQYYLIELYKEYANKLSSEIIIKLNCKWLNIATGFADFSKIGDYDCEDLIKANFHPLAKLLFNAQGFMQYKMLNSEQLIGKKESMMFLKYYGIGASDLAIITTINLIGIDLNIGGSGSE